MRRTPPRASPRPRFAGRAGRALALAALASLELEGSGRRQWLRALLPAGRGRERRRARPCAPGVARETIVRRRPPRRGTHRAVLAPAPGPAQRRPQRAPPGDRRLPAARRGRLRARRAALARRPARAAPCCSPPRSPRRRTSRARPPSRARATTRRASPPCSPSPPSWAPTRSRAPTSSCSPRAARSPAWAEWPRSCARHALDPARTFVIGLDTLGAGTPIQLRGEGVILTHRYARAGPRPRRRRRARGRPRAAAALAPRRLDGPDPRTLRRPAGGLAPLDGRRPHPGVPPADRHARARRLGLRGRLPRACARDPQNCGWRFSRNALTPSAKSGDAAHRSCARTSSSSVVERAGRAEASITRLASATAVGAHASSSPAS